jgi:hypothetical protein
VRAATGHVVAALGLFDEHVALRTSLPVPEVLLEVSLADPGVLGQLAFFTEPLPAPGTLQGVPGVHDALAVSGGAQPEVRVVHGLLPERVPPKAILGLLRQPIEDAALRVECLRAAFLGTGHLGHGVDLVAGVGVEADDAEPVLTAAHAVHIGSRVGLLAEFAFGAGDVVGQKIWYAEVIEVVIGDIELLDAPAQKGGSHGLK